MFPSEITRIELKYHFLNLSYPSTSYTITLPIQSYFYGSQLELFKGTIIEILFYCI